MTLFFASLISYLIGSIPFGLVLVYSFHKKNIRKEGSGNIGATNVLRNSSKILAFFTLILDCFKGFIIAFICKHLGLKLWFIPGFMAVIGHMFPIWLKFKGGKGVATILGFLLAINFYLFLAAIATWIFIAIIFKFSSLAALVMVLLIPFYSIALNLDNHITLLLILLSIMIIIKHKSNIIKLINKQEDKIKLLK